MNRFETYGFGGIVKLFMFYIKTKILFPEARLIRFPITIRGKKFIYFGRELTTGVGCRLEAFPNKERSIVLKIGNNVQINDYVHITAMKSVIIGDNVLMASKIYISDCTHGFYGKNGNSSPEEIPVLRDYDINPVEISDNVWIGESVSILPGVVIGKGAIIGANSVVTKSIQEYSIAVGNPARVIKKFNFINKRWEILNYTENEGK